MEEKKARRRKKVREKKGQVSKSPEVASPSPHKTEDAGRMDFGGLPNRDLKKNLGGCG